MHLKRILFLFAIALFSLFILPNKFSVKAEGSTSEERIELVTGDHDLRPGTCYVLSGRSPENVNFIFNDDGVYELKYDNLNAVASLWAGMHEYRFASGLNATLNIHCVGNNIIRGGNHPAIYLKGDGCNINIHFYMEKNSSLTLGHAYGDIAALRAVNNTGAVPSTYHIEIINDGGCSIRYENFNEPSQLYSDVRQACDLKIISEHSNVVSYPQINPTHTEPGRTAGSMCVDCGQIIFGMEDISPISEHQIVVDHGYDATCHSTGMSDGSHCSICGEIIEPQHELPRLEHQPVIDKGYDATCTSNGLSDGSHCALCGEKIIEQHIIEKLPHEIEIRNIVKATTTSEGYSGDSYCKVCGELLEEGHIVPKITIENVSDDIKNTFENNDKITVEEKVVIEEAIEIISSENLTEIVDATSSCYNELEELVKSGDLTQEEYEEKVEILDEVTKNAVIVGAQLENSSVEGATVNESLPADSGIDMVEVFSGFYQKVFDELLGNNNSGTSSGPTLLSLRLIDTKTSSGIDLDLSLETYQKVGEFVDSSVSNMKEAANLLRECSGESLKKEVKNYITKVSISSFRDFDPVKANADFVANAKEAILLNLQNQVLESLRESYEQATSVKGTDQKALQAIKDEYDAQVLAVSDIETFEIMIIEVMRQKFVSIINNRYNQELINKSEYDNLYNLATDVETFAPVYDSIFTSWALQIEDEYDIGLEELSNAAIESQGKVSTSIVKFTELTNLEISIILGIGISALLALAIYYASKIKKGMVKVYG